MLGARFAHAGSQGTKSKWISWILLQCGHLICLLLTVVAFIWRLYNEGEGFNYGGLVAAKPRQFGSWPKSGSGGTGLCSASLPFPIILVGLREYLTRLLFFGRE
jgi:hypothetical protein